MATHSVCHVFDDALGKIHGRFTVFTDELPELRPLIIIHSVDMRGFFLPFDNLIYLDDRTEEMPTARDPKVLRP